MVGGKEQRICFTKNWVPWHLQVFSAYKQAPGHIGAYRCTAGHELAPGYYSLAFAAFTDY